MSDNLYIIWNDSNRLGIPIIDEQHRGLITTINSLYYCMLNDQSMETVKSILIMLGQYTKIHFTTEESLMRKADYPDLEEHIGLHNELVKKTKRLYVDVDNDNISDRVLKLLKEWWMGHINKQDRKYVPYLVQD
jgi:hemerythrin-like metal-binding protein